jgi:RNA polymerase sigma-70 factor (ECF subfamily)
VRPWLFGIAYRMLGSATEADDVLQDAWLRWQSTDRAAVDQPAAFLATVTTRLAINALDSARARREVYVGPWLPEPVSTVDDPALGAERAEALEYAVVLLLERLSPAERAAYVLHEAFDYPFRLVAEVLETTEANARQLASRARTRLQRERGRTATPQQRERLLAAFVAAAQAGDLETLESLLVEDAVSLSDGGGVVTAARKPVLGRSRVAQFVLGVIDKFAEGVDVRPTMINGEAALIGFRDGVAITTWTVDVAPDGIRAIHMMLNPAKLARLPR